MTGIRIPNPSQISKYEDKHKVAQFCKKALVYCWVTKPERPFSELAAIMDEKATYRAIMIEIDARARQKRDEMRQLIDQNSVPTETLQKDVDKYIETHDIEPVFRELLLWLFFEQPDNPWAYISKWFVDFEKKQGKYQVQIEKRVSEHRLHRATADEVHECDDDEDATSIRDFIAKEAEKRRQADLEEGRLRREELQKERELKKKFICKNFTSFDEIPSKIALK